MTREAEADTTDGAAQPTGRVLVFGVDPADPRALPELPRRLPTDGTALHSVPALSEWASAERHPRRNPPGALLAAMGRTRGTTVRPDAFTAVVDDATADPDRSVHALDGAIEEPSLPRARLWTLATWTVTALAVAVPLAGLAAVVLSGGLLVATFAALGAIGAFSLFVGFGLARQAAAIRCHDAAAADVIAAADRIAAAEVIAADFAGDGAEHVVVVPARNAAGVAAALRERGIDAGARRVPPEDGPASRS